jgi:hypothetical protein
MTRDELMGFAPLYPSYALLNLGASFRYVYADVDAKPVMTIDTATQTCS